MLAQQGQDRIAVTHLADDQRGIQDRLPEAPGQIVEHDYALAALAQL
jgi:hypothetical protein